MQLLEIPFDSSRSGNGYHLKSTEGDTHFF